MLLNIEIYFESMKFFLLHRHSDEEDRSDFYLWRIRNFISRQQEVRQRKGLLAICSAGWQVKNKEEYPMSIVSFLCLHRYLSDLLSLLSGPFINQGHKTHWSFHWWVIFRLSRLSGVLQRGRNESPISLPAYGLAPIQCPAYGGIFERLLKHMVIYCHWPYPIHCP